MYNFEDQKQGFKQPPLTQPPMTSQYITPASSFRALPRRAVGSGHTTSTRSTSGQKTYLLPNMTRLCLVRSCQR